MDDDIDNFREAFELGLMLHREDDVALGVVALNGYYLNRYLAWEERSLLSRALPRIVDPEIRAHALRCAASKAQVTNDLETSLRLFEQAVDAYRKLDDNTGLAAALLSLAGLHSKRGEWEEGARAAEEAERLVETLDNPSAIGIAAYYQGENLAFGGNAKEGLAQLARASRLFRASGEIGRSSHALSALVMAAVVTGDRALASRNEARALEFARRSESSYRIARALGAVGAVEARWGDAEQARIRLLEANELMDAPGNERIFEFLFPAALLFRRLGHWEPLLEVLAAADQWMAAWRNGYPVPWRGLANELRTEALAEMEAEGLESPAPEAAPGIAEVSELVVRTLTADLTAATAAGAA